MASEEQSRIDALASVINSRTREISQYLKSQDMPSPSFSPTHPPELALPQYFAQAQSDVLVACVELQALMEGPLPYLTRITSPRINILMSLQAIYRFKIATHVPMNGEITYEELSQRAGIGENDLRRLMRLAQSAHIFHELKPGMVSHSAASKLIAEDPLTYEWIGIVCDEMWLSGGQTVAAMTQWPDSQEVGETGFVLANQGESFWDALKASPQRAQRFAAGMQFLQKQPAFHLSHLVESLRRDGSVISFKPTFLVDMGGSRGSVAMELLRQFPQLKCCVQDVPQMLHGVEIPSEFEGRLSFVSHDLFTEQTVKGADVYLLRSILHDWPDKYALEIIEHLVPALKPGARVIVNEICLPEPNTLPYYYAQLLHGYDLGMKQTCNSKERNAQEWQQLFASANERFRLKDITSPPGSILSVIEFVWQ